MPPTQSPLATAEALSARFGDRPFRLRDALTAKISRDRVDSAVRAGHLVQMRHGVLALSTALDACTSPEERHRMDAQALVLSLDPRSGPHGADAVLSHASAGAFHDHPFPALVTPPAWPVEITSERRRGMPPAGSTLHRAELPEAHVVQRLGMQVTSPARTAVDIAASRPLEDALVLADAVLACLVDTAARLSGREWEPRRELVRDPALVLAGRRVLRRIWAETGRTRGTARVHALVDLADPAAENPFESVSRARLVVAGLPRPEVGYPVIGDDGRRYWADLAWPEWRVLGEADGRGKYTDASVLYAEKLRQDSLERAVWIVVRWSWAELFHRPEVVVARVAAALDRARRAGLPRTG